MADPKDDASLVTAFLAGDDRAFEDIYGRYATLVFRVAMRALGDADQAESVVANTFAHASLRLSALRETDKLRAWLLAIATSEVNHVMRGLVRERRKRERLAALRPEVAIDPDSSTAEYARGVLEAVRAGLSVEDRALLGLVLAGVSGNDLAQTLGVDLGAADTRKSRLYNRLRLAVEVYWVTRPGHSQCAELDALLARRREPGLSRPLCRAVAHHCEHCEHCAEERQRVAPFALLGAAPLPALTLGSLQELWSRHGLIDPRPRPSLPDHGVKPTPGVRPLIPIARWTSDGFPDRGQAWPHIQQRRLRILTAAGVLLVLLTGAVLLIVVPSDGPSAPTAASRGREATAKANATDGTATSTPAVPTSVSQGGSPNPTQSTSPSALRHLPVVSPLTSTTLGAQQKVTHVGKHHPKHVPPPPVLASSTTTPSTTTPSTTTTVVASGQFVLDTATLNFDVASTSATITFHDVGNSLEWSAGATVSWLALQPSSGVLGANGSGSVVVMLDRVHAPAGALSAAVTFSAPSGSSTVRVSGDEEPPAVSGVTAPRMINCNASAMVSAMVSAPAGLGSAELSYTAPGGSATTIAMTAGTAGGYTGSVAALGVAGTMSWAVIVTDADGRSSATSSGTIQVGYPPRGCG